MFIAVKPFFHNKQYVAGDVVKAMGMQANKLLMKGLVVEVETENPIIPLAEPQSALQVGQASQQTIATKSKRGRKKKVVA